MTPQCGASVKVFWYAIQAYYEKSLTADGNTNDAYCQFNADPKIEKVREQFAEKVGP